MDLSDEALKVAVRNARTLEVAEHAEFVQSNLFSEMQNIVYGTEYMKRTAVKDTVKMTECENSNRNYSRAYDMIISNPPYIPTAEIEDLMDEVPQVQQPRHPAISIKVRMQVSDIEVKQRRFQQIIV